MFKGEIGPVWFGSSDLVRITYAPCNSSVSPGEEPARWVSPCRKVDRWKLQLPATAPAERPDRNLVVALGGGPTKCIEGNMVLRIAQVSHLFESVPPTLYGGTERVVSWLTEELVAIGGCEVTLFASGDSTTTARLQSIVPESLRRSKTIRDWVPVYVALLETVFRDAGNFDLIHFHIDTLPYPLFSRHSRPFLSTTHGRLDLPEYSMAYTMFPRVPLVSVSNAQRFPLPNLRWVKTIHHGLPPDMLKPSSSAPEYLAFLGRISPEKGIAPAIRIAQGVGLPLKIAAKIDKADAEYFESEIEPMLSAEIQYVGEIGDDHKSSFLGGAIALLFPIKWPEPFGLTMIESMACGTPVVGFNVASVPEVVENGLTGFIVDNEDEAVLAVQRAQQLDRNAIRARFEERFTARRMALEYLEVYQQILSASA